MEEIYSLLLSTIGLSFRDGRLYDDDEDMYLLYRKKYIVESDDKIARNSNAVLFDPIMNKPLMKYLFDVYIKKETDEGNLYLISYQIQYLNTTDALVGEKKLLMVLGNGAQITTREYYLETLAYMEAVFIATGMPLDDVPDLKKYDDKELLVVKDA